MDEIDFALCMMLVVNSRIPYRKLAETFKMSVNSIHKRIKSMVDLGIIQNFNTKLSFLNFSNPIHVILYGRSKIDNKTGLLQKLGNHECIFNVTQASDHLIYVHGLIKNFQGLDPLVLFVRQKGEINDLEIGLISTVPNPNVIQTSNVNQTSKINDAEEKGKVSLSNLDYLIINTLKNNSRNPLSNIAEEVGASTKTVRRHLEKLIDKNLIDFSIDWYPDKAAV
ncbi:MAG: winged helix-turn-helix transcriptional regulator, partial [Promethearchaeota archaeon]